MVPCHRVSTRIPVATLAAALTVMVSVPMSQAEPPEPREPCPDGRALSADERAQLDRLALELPPEARKRRKREHFGDLTSWLTERAPLPKAEETRRIEATHRKMLSIGPEAASAQGVQAVLERLAAELPRRRSRSAGQQRLFIIEHIERFVGTAGGGHLYLSTAELERILSDPRRGQDRLAFVLAHEMGHDHLGHCRRWYQRQWSREVLGRQVARIGSQGTTLGVDAASALAGTVMNRVEEPAETRSADLFALHLCRNAGFDVESALDVVRSEALAVLDKVTAESAANDLPRRSVLPLRRLRQLRMDLDGTVVHKGYGLSRYHDGDWVRVRDSELEGVDRALVLVHGMGADLSVFDLLVREVAPQLTGADVLLLGMHYPEHGSLSRSAGFLANELSRASAATAKFDFVAHSAGGLLARHLIEIRGHSFRSLTLLGTPHLGSDLTALRPLMEARQFFGQIRLGFSDEMIDVIEDENGQIVRDLEPGSLFLRALDQHTDHAARGRYRVVRGQAMGTKRGLALRAGVAAARTATIHVARRQLRTGPLRDAAVRWAGRLRVPDEIAAGDLVVSMQSATPEGVADVLTISRTHSSLPDDPEVVDLVRSVVFSMSSSSTGRRLPE